VTVLYTNIHYDIIYPRDGPVPSIVESCSHQTAQVQQPTAESSGQQLPREIAAVVRVQVNKLPREITAAVRVQVNILPRRSPLVRIQINM